MSKVIVRLKDIADRTGYSTNTVSLALRESPRIPARTREIIRQAADELNYLPNYVAKSLVSRETKTIGLILTDMTNPALTGTAQAIEIALAARGYGTLFATSTNTLSEEKRAIELFRSRQVDGMLIYPTSPRAIDHIRPLRRANYPVVLLIADPDGQLDSVAVDDRRGAYKATRHLIDLGHRRIGLIDGTNPMGNRAKSAGFLAALEEAGIAFDPALIADPGGLGARLGYRAMAALTAATPTAPTAVFAVNDALAIGALRWCAERGLEVPADLAVIGYDNNEFSEFASVPLSTVNYEIEQVTSRAVDRLMQLIAAGDRLPDPEITLIDPDLVIRSSTGAGGG